jgi:CheY-like chemotaxis protein
VQVRRRRHARARVDHSLALRGGDQPQWTTTSPTGPYSPWLSSAARDQAGCPTALWSSQTGTRCARLRAALRVARRRVRLVNVGAGVLRESVVRRAPDARSHPHGQAWRSLAHCPPSVLTYAVYLTSAVLRFHNHRRMPLMNGDDATAALRQRGVSIPIVGVTGDAQQDDVERFMHLGANEVRRLAHRRCACVTLAFRKVVTKPISRASLKGILDKYLGGDAVPQAGDGQRQLQHSRQTGTPSVAANDEHAVDVQDAQMS